MTIETTSSLSPQDVIHAAREFFLGPHRMANAWIESESESHLGFCTFRGNLCIGVARDPDDAALTRVRVTTLREEGMVPRLITYLGTLEPSPGRV